MLAYFRMVILDENAINAVVFNIFLVMLERKMRWTDVISLLSLHECLDDVMIVILEL